MSPHRNPHYCFYRNQSGVVLVISLIILLLLSLIGLSSVQVTSLEEKIAGNERDKNQAFQAAEAALKVGEDRVKGVNYDTDHNASALNCNHHSLTDGLMKANEENVEDSRFWEGSDVSIANVFNAVDRGNSPLAKPPKYVIECLPDNVFRITAYATGATTDAVVILQSVYSLGQLNGV